MPGEHDALVKKVFGVPENAAGELRAVLPDALVKRIRWDTLEPVQGSWVDELRREHHSDLLFRAKTVDGEAEVGLYVLFEHQSTVDPTMPIRLLVYLGRVYATLLDHRVAGPLPAIIPLVLHHSASGWTAPTSLGDLLALPPELDALTRDYVPHFEFLLDDVGQRSDLELLQRPMPTAAKLTVWLLAAIRRPFDPELIPRWLELTDRLRSEASREVAQAVFNYLTDEDVAEPILQALLAARTNSETEKTVMGLRKKWEDAALQKGIQKGREEGQRLGREEGERRGREEGERRGREEGREEGQRLGRAAALLKLLRLRFTELTDADTARVEAASMDELDRWTERVLTADDLETLWKD